MHSQTQSLKVMFGVIVQRITKDKLETFAITKQTIFFLSFVPSKRLKIIAITMFNYLLYNDKKNKIRSTRPSLNEPRVSALDLERGSF